VQAKSYSKSVKGVVPRIFLVFIHSNVHCDDGVCGKAHYIVEMCWTGRSGVEWGVGTGVEMWTGHVFSVESKWCGTSVKI